MGCKTEGSYFCEDCVSNILQTDLFCPCCDNKSIGGLTHPHCETNLGLDGLWSLGIYKNPLKEAIKQLKYGRVKGLAETLTDITVEYWTKYQPFILEQIKKDKKKDWVVIPVPLYWWRENSRGFNQSSLVGQLLSKKLGLDYCDGLKRIRHTKSQVTLKGFGRFQNIRSAFEVSPNCNLSPVTCVLLIDDVWTTGSTLRECCNVLKKAGAKKVWALTLAR